MIRTLITAAISLSVTIYFIVICVSGLSREYVEDGWKVAGGTILSQDIALAGPKNIHRKNGRIEQTINYEFTIGGKIVRSNSVSPEIFVNPQDYPEGKVIDIYYNPNDRTESVLIRTKVPKQYLYGFIAACVFVIFVILYCCARDIKARKN